MLVAIPLPESGRYRVTAMAPPRLAASAGGGTDHGIRDACNLSWKRAFVMKGAARPPLLDSYEAERLPEVLRWFLLAAGPPLHPPGRKIPATAKLSA